MKSRSDLLAMFCEVQCVNKYEKRHLMCKKITNFGTSFSLDELESPA